MAASLLGDAGAPGLHTTLQGLPLDRNSLQQALDYSVLRFEPVLFQGLLVFIDRTQSGLKKKKNKEKYILER